MHSPFSTVFGKHFDTTHRYNGTGTHYITYFRVRVRVCAASTGEHRALPTAAPPARPPAVECK